MKKLVTLMLILSCTLSNAQDKPKTPNTILDASGNYKEITDKKLPNTYTSKEGKVFEVYQNAKGKLYIITGISEKTGKPKKKYLVL